MATNRSRRHPRRRAGVALNPNTWHYLERGSHLLPWDDFQSQAEVKAAWETWRAAVLPEWVKLYPGTRPFAWWALEAIPRHGERRLLTHKEVAAWCRGHGCPVPPDVDLAGRAALLRGQAELFGVLHTETVPPMQESELTYLNRLDLLEDAEVRDLEAGRGHGASDPGRPDFWETVLQPLFEGA